MTPEQLMDIAKLSTSTLLWMIMPLMMVALLSGLLIALFQALTSIQEMTLTFVPKIILVFVSLILFLPFMSDKLSLLSNELYGRIAQIADPPSDNTPAQQ